MLNLKQYINMKNAFLMMLIIMMASCAGGGTILKNVPIQSDDAYIIKIWAYDDEIDNWRWGSSDSSMAAVVRGWEYSDMINVKVQPYDIFDIILIRGFDDCRDTTEVKIHGSYNKMVVKDKPDFRKIIKVDGSKYVFGKEIKRPDL